MYVPTHIAMRSYLAKYIRTAGNTAIQQYGWLARQLYSKKITQTNIGTFNKLNGGKILSLTSQPAV